MAKKRPGRKSDPNAKRKATTREGRGQAKDTGTAEAAEQRRAISGDAAIGVDFPLDVMLGRNLISEDERDEGLRFAMLAWWLYGLPHQGPELLYERIVSGVVDADLAPARELAVGDDPELRQREIDRIERNKARFERMTRALQSRQSFRGFTPLAGTVHQAVREVAQFLRLPLAVQKQANGRRLVARDYLELARIEHGLAKLVDLRDAENRAFKRRRDAEISASRLEGRSAVQDLTISRQQSVNT